MKDNLRCNKKFYNTNISINDIIKKCTNNNYTINKHIASGTYGKVFKTKFINSDGKTSFVAVKQINDNIKGLEDKEIKQIIENFRKEVKYCYKVSKMGIGPTIYDAFYYIRNSNFIGIIIMELFDKCISDLYYEKLYIHEYIFIHREMLKLIRSQIFISNIYCTDIKPENFIVKKENSKYIVRSIDYGSDWCSEEFPKDFKSKEYFYIIILIQLCLYIYTQIDRKKVDMLIPFYTDDILIKLSDNFRNFDKIQNVLCKVIKNMDGMQIKHYLTDDIYDILKIKITNCEQIAEIVIFLFKFLKYGSKYT